MTHRTDMSAGTSPHDDATRVVDAPAGRLVARVGGDVLRAGGIRYARAGRFAPPWDAPPAHGVVDATGFSPSAPQNPDPMGLDVFGPGSARPLPPTEDCLRLTVTAPADAVPGEDLPVVVWIHGGSYVSGAGDAISYDPHLLVREQRVVVVAVTYRLGVLGFLGDGRRPANLGLLDMLAALRWVARNIHAFGGDATSVTAMGESAGGDAIVHLMAAPDAAGLFHRAIVQSPPLGISRDRSRMSAAMAAVVGTVPDDAPVAELLAAQQRAARRVLPRYGLRAAMPYGVQPGFAPLPPADGLDAAWAHVAPRVQMLVGTNAREAALFVAGALPRTVVPGVGPRVREAAVRGLTRAVYGQAVDRLVEQHRRAGGHAARYTYLGGGTTHPLRAAHATELPLLLGEPAGWRGVPLVAGRSDDELLAAGRTLRAAWAQFARTGRPSADIPDLLGVDPDAEHTRKDPA